MADVRARVQTQLRERREWSLVAACVWVSVASLVGVRSRALFPCVLRSRCLSTQVLLLHALWGGAGVAWVRRCSQPPGAHRGLALTSDVLLAQATFLACGFAALQAPLLHAQVSAPGAPAALLQALTHCCSFPLCAARAAAAGAAQHRRLPAARTHC
jgi:hypothetical protein